MGFLPLLKICLAVCVWMWTLWPASARAEELPALPSDYEGLREAGIRSLNQGDLSLARQCGERLLQLEGPEGERYPAALYGHLLLGLANTESGSDSACYVHLETARAGAERHRDYEALMMVLNGFGNYSMFDNNDVYTALSYYFLALEEGKRVDNRRLYAMVLSNISGAYFMRGDFSGLRYADEAIRIAREEEEPVPLFYATMNRALYCLAADSLLPQAGVAIDALGQMHEAYGFGTESDLCLLRAQLHARRGETDGAYRYFAQAMENFPTASASTITMVYIEYAKLLRTDHRAASAVRVLEHGLEHIDSSGVPIHKARLLKELALSYREAGQTGKALECTLEYMEYQDRLFDEVRERATQAARIKHDIYAREQQISEQQVEILGNRYKIAVLTGLMLVLAVAVVLFYVFYRKKNRLYHAIVSQNREYMQREQLLLDQIGQLRKTASPSPVATDKLQDLMTRFTTLMMEEKAFTDSTLTVSSMAERLDTNRTYLSKAINENTGKTFTQLVNEYRIRQAISEISDLSADKPLKQIAAEVGFSSLSTFYATFQSITGMTPARYRSQLKGL